MRQTPRLTRFLSKGFSLLSTFFLIFGPNLADYVTAANDESFWSQNNQPLLRGFNNEAVTYVSTTKSNGIWLATDASIYSYSAAQFARIDISYSTFPQIPSSRIRSILEGRDGRTLLFSISPQTLNAPFRCIRRGNCDNYMTSAPKAIMTGQKKLYRARAL